MKIERALQINTATLTVTSALLLGMGQRDQHLPVLVMIAAAASIWLTDVAGWFRLNRVVASVLAVGAFLIVFREMFSLDKVLSIRAIAQMLFCLQIILLFQRKDRRIYWQLIVLSLLLVVVATVFNQGALFGLLMVAYLFMALSAMALVFLYHEARCHAPAEATAPARTDSAAPRRWPLGAEASSFKGSVAGEGDEEGRPGRDFLRQLVRMGLGALAFTAVVFFILPRFGQPAWRSPFYKQQRMVGYSGEVELGELGQVIEDPTDVLRIEFTDPATGSMVPVAGPVYLHGTVLTRYGTYHGKHRWTLVDARDFSHPLRVAKRVPPGEIVVQTVTIEPMDRPEVFCVQPCFTVEEDSELRFDPIRQSVLRPAERCGSRWVFDLRTNAFRDGRQRSLLPAERKPEVKRLLQVPEKQLPTLVALADRWMAEPGLPEERLIERARYLEKKLRDSEKFRYSLRAERQDYAIDPIEDFLKNNPRGHCEYFATTLALMLRSQRIPARMVVGYKCDEFNPLGKFFQVRQLHAHTWVEVYLAPQQVPPGEVRAGGGPRIWTEGAWLRLDPTPGTDADELGAAGRLLAAAGAGIDWLQYVWNNYVMEMDRSRQRQAIYQPLVDWVKGTYDRVTSLDWWKETLRQILHFFDPRQWNVDRWFSWRGGLIGMGICLVLVGFYRAARYLVRRLGCWIAARRRRAGGAARTDVDFYRRFQVILGRRGMRRAAWQTQREFARTVGRRLAEEPGIDELTPLPERIADAFYQVRFGGRPLDKTYRLAVEHAIRRLEEALGRHKFSRRRAKEAAVP